MSKIFKLSFTRSDLIRAGWAALFAFIGTYYVAATGMGPMKNFTEVKALIVALFPAAIAAAFSAFKNAILADGSTVKG